MYCFFNIASVLGHEVVYVVVVLEEVVSRPATLPKKVCIKEVFL